MCVRWNWGPTHPGHLCRPDLNWIRTLTRAMTPSQYPNYPPWLGPHPSISNHQPRFQEGRWTTAVLITPTCPNLFRRFNFIQKILATIVDRLNAHIFLKEPTELPESEVESADVCEEKPSLCKKSESSL